MIRGWTLAMAVLAGLGLPALADPLDDLRAGNAAYERGDFQSAVDAYTLAIISGGLSVEALAVTFNNRGVAYGELGDFDRAILDYAEALGLRPDDATAIRNLRVGHLRRGIARAERGAVSEAQADLTRAIELDPTHFMAYLKRGELRLERGETEAALVDLERAAALAPDDATVAAAVARARAVASAPAPAAGPTVEEAPPADVAIVTPSEPSGPAAGAAAPEPDGAAGPAEPPAAGAATVVTRQAVNVRSGPGNEFERLQTVPGGTRGAVIEVVRGWNHVELDDGRRGWIYESWLAPAAR